MTVAKRNKRAKPDPVLLKLSRQPAGQPQKPKDLIGENSLLKYLTKMLVARALEVGMTNHQGHDKSGQVCNDTANTRNGHSGKIIKCDFDALPLDIPRDHQGTLVPQIVGKHQTLSADSTTKSSRSKPEGRRSGRSRAIWRRCTAPRWVPQA